MPLWNRKTEGRYFVSFLSAAYDNKGSRKGKAKLYNHYNYNTLIALNLISVAYNSVNTELSISARFDQRFLGVLVQEF